MISAARRNIVYRSIKRALLKGREVEYWTMRMYDQLDAGVLTDAQVSELEQIIEQYYGGQDEPEPEPVLSPEPEQEPQPEADGE